MQPASHSVSCCAPSSCATIGAILCSVTESSTCSTKAKRCTASSARSIPGRSAPDTAARLTRCRRSLAPWPCCRMWSWPGTRTISRACGTRNRTSCRTASSLTLPPSATRISTCGGSSPSPSKKPPRASSCRQKARSLREVRKKLILKLNQQDSAKLLHNSLILHAFLSGTFCTQMTERLEGRAAPGCRAGCREPRCRSGR